jgi:hypothetical protein
VSEWNCYASKPEERVEDGSLDPEGAPTAPASDESPAIGFEGSSKLLSDYKIVT